MVSVSIIRHEITYAVIEAAISRSIAFLDVVNVSLDGEYEYRCKMHCQKCEEAEEVAVVDHAHAIVQPWTVVVPPLSASVADIWGISAEAPTFPSSFCTKSRSDGYGKR